MLKNSFKKNLVEKTGQKTCWEYSQENTRRKIFVRKKLNGKARWKKLVGKNSTEKLDKKKSHTKKLIRKKLGGKYSSENTHPKILVQKYFSENTCPKILIGKYSSETGNSINGSAIMSSTRRVLLSVSKYSYYFQLVRR